MTYPVGAHSCECARCFRGCTSLDAFDAHQRHWKVCLEPSSIGLWFATDGMWSLAPRSATQEAIERRAHGLRARVNLKHPQEAPARPANSDAGPERD